MIIDTLENIDFYFGLSKELDYALSVLKHYNLSVLEPGEYQDFPISGCNTTLRLLKPDMVSEDVGIPWEYHEGIIDVQCVLSGGSEIIAYTPRNKISNWDTCVSSDAAYSNDDCEYLPIKLDKQSFAIFFPQDAHRKIYGVGEDYRKIVLKVPIEGFRGIKK